MLFITRIRSKQGLTMTSSVAADCKYKGLVILACRSAITTCCFDVAFISPVIASAKSMLRGFAALSLPVVLHKLPQLSAPTAFDASNAMCSIPW
jgi:hypothetical protein